MSLNFFCVGGVDIIRFLLIILGGVSWNGEVVGLNGGGSVLMGGGKKLCIFLLFVIFFPCGVAQNFARYLLKPTKFFHVKDLTQFLPPLNLLELR